jgi:2-hydroxy-3-keto-5-methylthiopentenyl-1-phosphate phosphatase
VEIEDGFKLSFASAFRNAGDCVVYFGDGASDIPAALMAQAVFARDTLLERLAGHSRPLFTFGTFHDAIIVLEKEARAWLESFSSTTAAGA